MNNATSSPSPKCPCGRPAATATEHAKAHTEGKCVVCYQVSQYAAMTAKKASQS